MADSNWLETAQQGDLTALDALVAQTLSNQNFTTRLSPDGSTCRLELVEQPWEAQARNLGRLETVFAEHDLPPALTVELCRQSSDSAPADWQTTLVIALETPDVAATPEDRAETESLSLLNHLPDVKAVTGAVGAAASSVGQAAVQGGSQVSGAIAGTAKSIGETALSAGGSLGQKSVTALSAVGQTALSVPQGLGELVKAIEARPELKGLTKVLKMDWLLKVVDQVDVEKAEAQVRQLQADYPDETPAQISRRLMIQKALYVSGTGLASGLVPGFAAAIVAVDLAATTALQAEMGYQIACAYGFDIRDGDRKGEVLAIFGLAMGSNQALKTGLTYLARGIPIAGAAIGASANAVALYAVGHAAMQYYEAKRNDPEAAVELEQLAEAQTRQDIAAQKILMDRILTHVVVAAYPHQVWEDFAAELTPLNLSPGTLQVIQQEVDNPSPLEDLVSQLDAEFAVFLLAQCQRIAELDGVVSDTEAAVLKTIADQLENPSDVEPSASPASHDAPPVTEPRSLAHNIRHYLTDWRHRRKKSRQPEVVAAEE